jgi:hypothetical protein
MQLGSWELAIGSCLDSLDRERDPVAATQTECRDPALEIPLLERVEKCCEHAGAAGANRMAKRDGAAVHIDFARLDAQFAQHSDCLNGERLVQFDQIDILEGPTDLLHQPPHRFDGCH